MSYILPELSYNYDALEPYIDKKTMQIHHTKHHQTYINNLNIALKGTHFINIKIDKLIKNLDILPENKKTIVRNNGGGHINHSFFWKILKKNTQLNNKLKTIIENNFGSFENFKLEFEKLSISHFGSGWAWLIKNNNHLSIVSTKNQDNPIMGESIVGLSSGTPILGIDLWEHSYYLKYQNNRLNYIQAFWSIINWNKVESLFFKN